MEELIQLLNPETRFFILKELPWYFIICWFVYSFFTVFLKSFRKKFSNFLLVESIPNIFVVLGLYGTFSGIVYGLSEFDTSPNKIKESIPLLLEGLKIAMTSSLLGIFLSLFFGKIIRIGVSNERIKPPESLELLELRKLNTGMSNFLESISTNQYNALKDAMEKVLEDFNNVFVKFLDELVQENFKELTETINTLTDWQKQHKEEIEKLHKTYQALVDKHEGFVNKTDEWVKKLDQISGQSSKLQTIIDEFNEAFNEDGNMSRILKEIQSSTTDLNIATTNIKEISTSVEETSKNVILTGDKVTGWTDKVENVSESAANIIEKVEALQNINMKHIDSLVDEFNIKLKRTFATFDTLIEKYIEDIENRFDN